MKRRLPWAVVPVAFGLALTASAARTRAATLSVNSNKQSYILGEPILLRTVLSVPVPSGSSAMHLGKYSLRNPRRGFILLLRAPGGKDVCWTDRRNYRLGSAPPILDPDYMDKQYFPGHWRPRERYQRVDMLVLDRPGKYAVKAGLRHVGGFQLLSEPIMIEVRVPEKADPVGALLTGEAVRDLGYLLCELHFLQGRTMIGAKERLSRDAFVKIAPEIIDKCKGSVFREYVIYAAILIDFAEMRTLGHTRLKDPRIIKLAEKFVADRRDSWLWPHVCRILVHHYVANRTIEGNVDKAMALGEEGLLMDPLPMVLINPGGIRETVRYLKRKRLAEKRKARQPRE